MEELKMKNFLANFSSFQGSPKRFFLAREMDVSGVSGTGIVAEGVEFSNGKVVMCWLTNDVHSIVIHDSIEALLSVHGHNGSTEVVWLDQLETQHIN